MAAANVRNDCSLPANAQAGGPASAPADGRRYRAAAGTAAIAAAFCLVVCALMAGRKIRDRDAHPLDSPQALALAADREKLLKDSANNELREQIRRQDKSLMDRYLRNQAFYDRGAWLLVGGGAVFLIGAGLAVRSRRKLPLPAPGDVSGCDARLARWGRAAVAVLALLGGGGTAYLAATAEALEYEEALPKPPPKPPERVVGIWPRFRGAGGLGLAPKADPPLRFDGKAGKNIAWKTLVPLPGHSSPVIAGGRVFLTGADLHDKRRQVYCFDAVSGKLLWAREVNEGPKRTKKPEYVMEETGFAAPTMVADEKRVYAIFAMGEIVCFDHAGKKVWGRFLGPLDTEYGHAASLAMHQVSKTKARLVVQLDQATEEDGKSKLVAVDAATGKTDWEVVKRPVGSAWTSPIVIRTPQGPQIITLANPWTIAYDADGKELWRVDCLEGDGAPSAIFAGGMVIAGNVSSRICAIRPDGRGDVTKTHVAWSYEDDVPDVCSPVSDGKHVYMLTSDGLLTCLKLAAEKKPPAEKKPADGEDLADDRKLYAHDLEAPFSASPTLVGDRLFLLGTKGLMIVGRVGKKFQELARSQLGEDCQATPAFLGDRIWIRAQKHLYCIREKK